MILIYDSEVDIYDPKGFLQLVTGDIFVFTNNESHGLWTDALLPSNNKPIMPYYRQKWVLVTVWPDWAIYWTLENFLKPLVTIILLKSPSFLGNFCKCVKIFNFCREIIFGQIL